MHFCPSVKSNFLQVWLQLVSFITALKECDSNLLIVQIQEQF